MGQSVEPNRQLQARYAYYRRCQVVLGGGEQCRCPAVKGSDICRNHAEQKRTAERRLAQQVDVLSRAATKLMEATGRKHVIDDLFGSPRGIQVALNEAMQAIVEDRIDEKAARELMGELEKAAGELEKHLPQRAQRSQRKQERKQKLHRGGAETRRKSGDRGSGDRKGEASDVSPRGNSLMQLGGGDGVGISPLLVARKLTPSRSR